jgi:hypothetical protein
VGCSERTKVDFSGGNGTATGLVSHEKRAPACSELDHDHLNLPSASHINRSQQRAMSDKPPTPMSIGSPHQRDGVDQPPSGASQSAQDTPGDRRYGTPPVANIPPRMFGSPRPPSTVPNYGSVPQRPAFNPGPTSGSGTATPTVNAEDDDLARVVRRHLVPAEERSDTPRRPSAGGISLARPAFLSRHPSSGAGSTNPNPTPGPDLEETFPIPYGSHGGDVT